MQSRVAVAASTGVRSVGIDRYADPTRAVPVSARDIASTSGIDETLVVCNLDDRSHSLSDERRDAAPSCSTLSRTRLHLRGSDDERDEL